jgi:hypothetical protein
MTTKKKPARVSSPNNPDLFSNLEKLDDEVLQQVERKVQEIRVSRTKKNFPFTVGRYQYVYEPSLQQLFSLKDDGHLYPSSYQFLVDVAVRSTSNRAFLIRNLIEHMMGILGHLSRIAV